METRESAGLPALDVPARWRAFVYLVGMLGFPVIVATYILVVLAADLRQLDKSVGSLAARIDERPLGIEKATDFVIYLTDALRADLQSGLPRLVAALDLESGSSQEELSRTVTLVKREIEGYIRPIVRRHQRFAALFPTDGGNLGSYFGLSSPAENIEAGEAEAHLRGRTSKDFSEALATMLVNNLFQFGQLPRSGVGEPSAEEIAQLRAIFGGSADALLAHEKDDSTVRPSDTIVLINADLLLRLSMDSIETATTVLRDQMLETLRLSSTQLED